MDRFSGTFWHFLRPSRLMNILLFCFSNFTLRWPECKDSLKQLVFSSFSKSFRINASHLSAIFISLEWQLLCNKQWHTPHPTFMHPKKWIDVLGVLIRRKKMSIHFAIEFCFLWLLSNGVAERTQNVAIEKCPSQSHSNANTLNIQSIRRSQPCADDQTT